VNISYFILITISIFALIINYKFRKTISIKLKLFDSPKKKISIHRKKTPLNGCLAIYFSFAVISLYLTHLYKNQYLMIILILGSIFFIIGLIDDRKNINPYLKLFLIIFFLIYFLKSNNEFLINNLYFKSFNKKIEFTEGALFLTILCILLFINSLNLLDGINGLANLAALLYLVYLNFFIGQDLILINIPLCILLLLNFYPIYKGKYFIGNNGSLFLGIILSLITIKIYNESSLTNIIAVEEIFILFAIPGYDMFRLFIERIINNKNPFFGDLQHLHHYLLFNYKLTKSLLIYIFIICLPLILINLKIFNYLYIIIFQLIIYVFIIYFLKKRLALKNYTKN
jgi:UDP-GlcNAc:undecaprenyl-phosphate GlcNAc-1-phosphate transferase